MVKVNSRRQHQIPKCFTTPVNVTEGSTYSQQKHNGRACERLYQQHSHDWCTHQHSTTYTPTLTSNCTRTHTNLNLSFFSRRLQWCRRKLMKNGRVNQR